MKRLVGTFRTEEEAILAINDLKEMGLDANEISVVTNDPYEYKMLKDTMDTRVEEKVIVGDLFHGPGVHEFVASLTHYGIPEENTAIYRDRLHEGNILVFIGVNDEIRNHIENPGTYRAPDLFIKDIMTPGTFTITKRFKEDPDNPGTYVALDYGFRKTTPGTYEDPHVDEEILNPGSITEEDVIHPPHHMEKVDED
ncbi:general stress protein [Proteiniclasticum sp. SCR006]|uniref:General stress protein n=1 Tax=Proteiniclasticum aestuarii TaxID=2817862 RepID=A0A939HDK1_9CLOT|nr:general stress protein [Proteiniclasticum aestuarii]MBO1266017.1 general stress protein [Proteiniclasticum aestuarii]